MDTKIKHRIIGLIVLIALIVIFLPMLIKKQRREVDMVIQTPPKPQVTENVLKMPQSAQENQTVNSAPVIGSNSTQKVNPQTTLPVQPISESSPVVKQAPVMPPKKAMAPVVVKPSATAQSVTVKTSTISKPQTELPAPSKAIKSLYKPVIQKASKIMTPVIEKPKVSYTARKKLVKKLEQAWVVQLGSFTQTTRAQGLVKRLRQSGFKAFCYSVNTAKGKITRVYVGPVVHKDQASMLLEKIEHKTHIKGFTTPYKPTKL